MFTLFRIWQTFRIGQPRSHIIGLMSALLILAGVIKVIEAALQ